MKNYDGENADITKDIIACAIEVHKTLGGPGILEKAYQRALAYELQSHGHRAQLEAPCPIVYKGNAYKSLTQGRASQHFACRKTPRDHAYIVDCHRYCKSATARGWYAKMAMLFRFAPFRDQVQVQSVPLKCP